MIDHQNGRPFCFSDVTKIYGTAFFFYPAATPTSNSFLLKHRVRNRRYNFAPKFILH